MTLCINHNHNFLLATPRCKRLQTLQQWRSVFDVASVADANRYRSGNLRLIAVAIGPRKIWSTTNRVCVGVNWRKRQFAAEWPRKGAGPAPQLLMAISRYRMDRVQKVGISLRLFVMKIMLRSKHSSWPMNGPTGMINAASDTI